MKYTRDEYARGILSWKTSNPNLRLAFRTATTPAPAEDPGEWSGPLTDPDGSKVQSPPHPFMKLSLSPASAVQNVEWVACEREEVTHYWHGPPIGPPIKISFVPSLGTFHRLVISTPDLDWPEDVVIRHDGARVRFVHGEIHGERAEAMDHVELGTEGEGLLAGGRFGSATASGRLLEIVAPGESREEARERAHGIWGLVALAIGEEAIGQVEFTESYLVTVEAQEGHLAFPVSARKPRTAEDADVDTLDMLLPFAIGRSERQLGRLQALRWYQKSLEESTPIDKFFALFIGIEGLVNTFAVVAGPIPQVAERLSLIRSAVDGIASGMTKDERSLLLNRFSQPTLNERFAYYAEKASLAPDIIDDFKRANRERGNAFHGDIANIDQQLVSATRRILLRMLKVEFGVLGKLPTEQVPKATEVGIEYHIVRDSGEDHTTKR